LKFAESPMGITLKSVSHNQNFESSCLFSANFGFSPHKDGALLDSSVWHTG